MTLFDRFAMSVLKYTVIAFAYCVCGVVFGFVLRGDKPQDLKGSPKLEAKASVPRFSVMGSANAAVGDPQEPAPAGAGQAPAPLAPAGRDRFRLGETPVEDKYTKWDMDHTFKLHIYHHFPDQNPQQNEGMARMVSTQVQDQVRAALAERPVALPQVIVRKPKKRAHRMKRVAGVQRVQGQVQSQGTEDAAMHDIGCFFREVAVGSAPFVGGALNKRINKDC